MRKNILKRVIAAVGVASCCMCLLSAPISTLPVQAAASGNQNVAEPNHAIKEWVYGEKDGKLYKRLWNCSTGYFEGDWIYVRDL